MSRRLAGVPPEYGTLETVAAKRMRPNPAQKLTGRSQSEPVTIAPPMPMATPIASSVTNEDDAVSITKEQMLKILSREMPMDQASIVETFMSNSHITNQQVPSIYSSYFFRKDIIQQFQKDVINQLPLDKLSGFPLSTYKLYNKDDILNNTTFKKDVIGIRNIEKTSGYTTRSINNMKKFITYLSKKVCSDIKPSYAKSAVERAIHLTNNEEKFDILVASTKVIEDVSLSLDRRLEGVVAFVIVELGECQKYPAAYSINLICTNTKTAIAGTGSVLMGAFLYTILSHPDNPVPTTPVQFPKGDSFLRVTSKRLSNGTLIEHCSFGSTEPLVPVQQIAVLELASAYANPGGLCMYEKFGFAYDPTMFSDDSKGIHCFPDRDNLPMLIDFNGKKGYAELDNDGKKHKVASITAGADKGFAKSTICSLRGDFQRLLGALKSIQLYVDNGTTVTVDDFDPQSVYGLIALKLKGANTSIDVPLRNAIAYLETPNAVEDPVMKNTLNELILYLPAEKKRKTGGSFKNSIRKSNRHTKKRH